jgi:hypothetical protein
MAKYSIDSTAYFFFNVSPSFLIGKTCKTLFSRTRRVCDLKIPLLVRKYLETDFFLLFRKSEKEKRLTTDKKYTGFVQAKDKISTKECRQQ